MTNEEESEDVSESNQNQVMSRWQSRLRQKQSLAKDAASSPGSIAQKAKTISKWVRIAQLLWPLAPFIAVAIGIIFIILFIIIGYYYMDQEGILPAVLKGLL